MKAGYMWALPATVRAGVSHVKSNKTKILAVASAGGHWEQLMLLRPTLTRYDVCYATTDLAIAHRHDIGNADRLPDCNQKTPLRSLICAFAALALVLRRRPQMIVSTGSAPGFFCLLAGRLTGARTLWIDSIANAEKISLSGSLSRIIADECWTQWEHLASGNRLHYRGALF